MSDLEDAVVAAVVHVGEEDEVVGEGLGHGLLVQRQRGQHRRHVPARTHAARSDCNRVIANHTGTDSVCAMLWYGVW